METTVETPRESETSGDYSWLYPAALILISFAPLLFMHFQHLWRTEHYQYFPFVLVAVVALSWKKIVPTPVATEKAGRIRLVRAGLLVMGFLLLVAAALIWSPGLGMVGAILALGAFMFPIGLLPEWLLLWLLVPLPYYLDDDLTNYLQGVASKSASVVLDFVGTNHVLTGYTVEVPERQFLVEEACSGIHSLFVLIAFTAIYVVAQRRAVLHSLLLIACAVGWATLVNVVRVTVVVVLGTHTGIDVSTGLPHEALGMALFIVALVMLLCTDRLLLFVGTSREAALEAAASAGRDPSRTATPDEQTRPGFGLHIGWLVPAAFSLVLLLQAAPFLDKLKLLDGGPIPELAFSAESFPGEVGGWTRVSYRAEERDRFSDIGARSAIWNFRFEDMDAVVSLDYPFVGWHHLPVCYRAIGWRTRSWRAWGNETDPRDASDAEVTLERATGNALLLFCEFDQDQKLMSVPQHGRFSFKQRAMRELLRHGALYGYSGRTFQFQVFCTADQPLTGEQSERLRALYLEAKQIILQNVRSQSS